ncbi:sensor histidine kinase [Streptomyces fumanus]|uniref:sensor histidine kinase n=1 Tax=Streptomyces fumanus TaxID=67302 RepID=UPI001E59AA7F|nr:HAMP domain-containing sensor histidine kinase [Streptomyces fumanus]
MPRNTVRFRLTLLYGGVFLVSGVALLAITFFLVDRADPGLYVYNGQGGAATVKEVAKPPGKNGPQELSNEGGDLPAPDVGESEALVELAKRQKDERRHTLLVQGGTALGFMAVVSAGLGWVLAGRVLRRLSTITRTAREISATNLHARLALPGPADELKDLGDTFDELLARLEAAFEAQRRFVANASHELRTPMTRQRALGQVALADPDASVESLREAHLRILAAGREQERLITSLLTLARGQAGLERWVPFDLQRLTGKVVAARDDEAERRGVSWRTTLDPAVAVGGAGLAERLVINLVDNALSYNIPGGWVEVTTRTEGDRAVLTVSNSGPVVADDELDRLFQPFQRVGTARMHRREGLGLGLSIVSAVATAHHADLDAVPRPDGGLTVTVRFPGAAADPAAGPAAVERV